jgi:hypothetical protein
MAPNWAVSDQVNAVLSVAHQPTNHHHHHYELNLNTPSPTTNQPTSLATNLNAIDGVGKRRMEEGRTKKDAILEFG